MLPSKKQNVCMELHQFCVTASYPPGALQMSTPVCFLVCVLAYAETVQQSLQKSEVL